MHQGPLANVTPNTHTHTPILLRGRCEAALHSPVIRAAPLRSVTGQAAVGPPGHERQAQAPREQQGTGGLGTGSDRSGSKEELLRVLPHHSPMWPQARRAATSEGLHAWSEPRTNTKMEQMQERPWRPRVNS